MKYPYEKHLVICIGARCNNPDRGEDRGEILRDELKILNKKLGRKPTIRVCSVSCLDLCKLGPNMIAYPEGTVYSHLDRKSARRVYAGEAGDGPRAEDKILSREEFEECRAKEET